MFFNEFKKFSNHIALIDENSKETTYDQLDKICDSMKSVLIERAIAFVYCENDSDCVISYVSCLKNGVVPLMLDRKIDPELSNRLINIYKPKYLFMPKDIEDEKIIGKCIHEFDNYFVLETDNEIYPVNPDLCLLLCTSGSVGSPKLVRQSFKNVQCNANSISQYLSLDQNERPITTLPMNYTYGLSIINSHLTSGATILLAKSTVVSKQFWDFFKAQGATSFGGVPFTYEMLKRIKFFRMELPSLKTMTQSGAKITENLFLEFAQWAKDNGKNFVAMYGQTEATSRMTYLPPELATEKVGSIGKAIPGGRLALIDTDGKEIEETEATGELIYFGDNVTLGYAECAEDLIKADERNGRLPTGDIARRDSDGYYYIVGRIKRFLKLYGNRVNLDEIDRLVKSHFDVDCASVGTDSKCITYITDESLIDEVERFLSNKTNLNSNAFKAVYIEEIPKNTAGKVLFSQLSNIL